MNEKISFELDFPPLEPPDGWQLKAIECWQLADGSMLYKVEGKLVAELPRVTLIDADLRLTGRG